MTEEERAQFLPATRTFKSVLEKENVDTGYSAAIEGGESHALKMMREYN